eukprot:TRINITY_DN3126_c0_g1_i1.p1 TRINITY_DN3126_c0_g1~~TRINITY_DN3126_c0_g1_i1.p1  ORF type:complete len:956 (+),score=286.11 TRINITY_DN3126_c0_g1_i1:1057-3924(+)
MIDFEIGEEDLKEILTEGTAVEIMNDFLQLLNSRIIDFETFYGDNKDYLIHFIAKYNSYSLLQQILLDSKFPIDVNKQNAEGNTALMISIMHESEEVFDILVENEANVEICNNSGMVAIHIAAYCGTFSMVKILSELHPSFANVRDEDGQNVCHFAAAGGNVDTVFYLVSRYGLAVNDLTKTNDTPLHMAIEAKNNKAAKIMLRFLPDINFSVAEILPIPYFCIYHDNFEIFCDVLKRWGNTIEPCHVNLEKFSTIYYHIYNLELPENFNFGEHGFRHEDNSKSIEINLFNFSVFLSRFAYVKNLCTKKAFIHSLIVLTVQNPLYLLLSNEWFYKTDCDTRCDLFKSFFLFHNFESPEGLYCFGVLLSMTNVFEEDRLSVCEELLAICTNVNCESLNMNRVNSIRNEYNIPQKSKVITLVDDICSKGFGPVGIAIELNFVVMLNVLQALGYDLTYSGNRLCCNLAAELDKSEAFIRLVQLGVDPFCLDSYDQNFLHIAATKGHVGFLKDVIDFLYSSNMYFDIYSKDKNDMTPLFCALSNGNVDVAEYFVDDLNVTILHKETSNFNPAALSADLKVLEFLNTHGINIFSFIVDGTHFKFRSSLDRAIVEKDLSTVKYLSSMLDNISEWYDTVEFMKRCTPLHLCVIVNSPEILEYLLENNVNPNIVSPLKGILDCFEQLDVDVSDSINFLTNTTKLNRFDENNTNRPISCNDIFEDSELSVIDLAVLLYDKNPQLLKILLKTIPNLDLENCVDGTLILKETLIRAISIATLRNFDALSYMLSHLNCSKQFLFEKTTLSYSPLELAIIFHTFNALPLFNTLLEPNRIEIFEEYPSIVRTIPKDITEFIISMCVNQRDITLMTISIEYLYLLPDWNDINVFLEEKQVKMARMCYEQLVSMEKNLKGTSRGESALLTSFFRQQRMERFEKMILHEELLQKMATAQKAASKYQKIRSKH